MLLKSLGLFLFVAICSPSVNATNAANDDQSKCTCNADEIPPGSKAWYFSYILPNGSKVQNVSRKNSTDEALAACAEAIKEVPACQPNNFGKDTLARFRRGDKSFDTLATDWNEQVPEKISALEISPNRGEFYELKAPSGTTDFLDHSLLRIQGRYIYWSSPGRGVALDDIFSRIDVMKGFNSTGGTLPWDDKRKESFAKPDGLNVSEPSRLTLKMSPSGNYLLTEFSNNEIWFSEIGTEESSLIWWRINSIVILLSTFSPMTLPFF